MQLQMNDVMAHMEALSTVNCNPELQGGDLQISSRPTKSRGARQKKK